MKQEKRYEIMNWIKIISLIGLFFGLHYFIGRLGFDSITTATIVIVLYLIGGVLILKYIK